MRVRHTLRIVNWSAAALVLAVLILGKDRDYAWIGVVLLAALCLHFLIETVALLRHGGFRRRLADTREFKGHRAFQVKDLDAALSADALVSGVTLPVILEGTVAGDAGREAPLSGRRAVAWRLVAEPLEGMGKVGGQVLVVENWWGEMSLRDETGAVPLLGPGVLDGSSLVERVYSVKSLRSELPAVASRVVDGLGIKDGKESRAARIALREIALFPKDKVRVYGKAQRASGRTGIFGTDTLDDPDSLLVRSAARPASSRIPRRLFKTMTFAAVSIVLLAGLAVFATTTAAATMFRPGGLFDATRTGKVRLDLDGRQLRVSIGDSHWTLASGDTTKGYALTGGSSGGSSGESSDFTAARAAVVKVQLIHPSTVSMRNGDEGYPRWDGAAWIFEAGPGRTRASAAAPAASAADRRSGPLYIRNLTGSAVTVRVLHPDDSPVIDTTWTFTSYEAADDPRGHYLELRGKGALQVTADSRVEITTRKGSYRILPLAAVARWGTSSWLLELAPENVAGAGSLFVKNSGDSPVRIWLLGSDGNALYGDDPWMFEPGEGANENKGLRLQYADKNIVMTGREAIRLETQELTTVYEGTLERIGTWAKGAWTIDLSRANG